MSPARKVDLEIRFWEKVDKNGPNGCWLWTGSRNKAGYGYTSENGKTLYAHRVAMRVQGVPLKDDQLACHHCDNPPCVRGDHLFAGTYLDNNRDKTNKGRHPNSLKRRCKRGHAFTPSNTRINVNGSRSCAICIEYEALLKRVERQLKRKGA